MGGLEAELAAAGARDCPVARRWIKVCGACMVHTAIGPLALGDREIGDHLEIREGTARSLSGRICGLPG
jgi:hypothetical protein